MIFGIAAADVGMIAGEPNLVELFRFVLPVWFQNGAAASPRYAFEILAALVDRLEVSRVLHVGGKVPVVRPIGKETLHPIAATASQMPMK